MELHKDPVGVGDHHDRQMAPAQEQMSPAALEGRRVAKPATVEEMHARLDRILEACEFLQGVIRDQSVVTQREVAKLRRAFWLATGKTEKLQGHIAEGDPDPFRLDAHSVEERCNNVSEGGEDMQSPHAVKTPTKENDAKILACDQALNELEEYTKRMPEAFTCDLDDADGKGQRGWGIPGWWRLLNTPFECRLQTFIVSAFTFFTFIPIAFVLTVIFLMNQWTMPFMVMYLLYIFTMGRPVHPLKKCTSFSRHSIWHHHGNYFPVRLVIPDHVRRQFHASKNYFFVYHPHGIHAYGTISKFGFDSNLSSLLPGITVHPQTLKINFFIPFWRELSILTGFGDASADCIRRTLRAGPGESVVLVVGGAQESVLARPHTNDLTLRGRRGFVRIALEEGAPLVPVYAFGENDVYRVPRIARSERWKRVERAFRRATSFAFPLFVGRGWFNYGLGPLPHRRPIAVVVGEPLLVPKIPQPTDEDVRVWHEKYVEALTQLFDKYHCVYDVDSSGLCIH